MIKKQNSMDILLKKKPWYIKYRTHLITGGMALALLVYVSVLAFGPRTEKVSAEECTISKVEKGHFLEYIDVEGTVQPIKTIKVNSQEGGFVDRIVADEGSMVEVGDTILILSNPELLRSIDDEQTTWEKSQRNYKEQEIEMEQKSISLRQEALDAAHQMASLEKSLKQSREEYSMGIKSKAELEVAEEDYKYQYQKAQLQMQGLRHDSIAAILKREMLQSDRETANRNYRRTRDRLGKLVVRATTSGQLSNLQVTLGDQVAAGSSVAEIKIMSQYKVHTLINEYYIDRITTGLNASIQFGGKEFPLRISKIVPEVKEHSFDCDLVVTGSKPDNMRLGKSYRVKIELDKPEMTVVIPRGDFYQATSGEWIYRLSPDGKTAYKTRIEIGRQNPLQYEVLSGLKPGDRVITDGYSKLGDSNKITITQ